MSTVNLWDDDDDLVADPSADEYTLSAPTVPSQASGPIAKAKGPFVVPEFTKKTYLEVNGDEITLVSKVDLRRNKAISNDLNSMYRLEEEERDGHYIYACSLGAINAYILRYILAKTGVEMAPNAGKQLKVAADKLWEPKIFLSENGKNLEYRTPNIKTYTDVAKKVAGWPTQKSWNINISRVLDVEGIIGNMETTLPKPILAPEVLALSRNPIAGFDGSLESLKTIPVGSLNVISANHQTHKNLKTSKKTLEEKISDFGIKNLYDLLFYLPKRFIDKSNPQELEHLLEGETVTIVGKVASANNLPNNMGIYFEIENSRGRKIKANFWRQQWLKTKFNVGDEVLLTGKAAWFKRKLELGGSSIEHLEEANILPIVPVYKQSESKGITTKLLLAANRELISRAGKIHLPPYFNENGRMDYTEALSELHFPTSIAKFKQACDDLAYYELVYMQIIMQEEKATNTGKKGVAQKKNEELNLQNKAARALPFRLTKSQIAAVRKIDTLLESESPSQSLISADVGSGKTVLAHLSCMRAVESGHQAAIVGPTDILARQLYNTLESVVKPLQDAGEDIAIAYMGSKMKVAEKKPILAGLKDGSIDIVVGTTSVIGEKVEYNNLSLVVVDEQQKFGAEQRTRLLSARADGLVPDLLLMSATPIPRSTAQVFYGDMELIELSGKPPGRLPIITEWLEEDPIELAHQWSHPVWSDVRDEADKGNQTFVVTPMVADTDSVDAASVERTFKSLSTTTLKGLNVGFVHGKMKKEESDAVMSDFRAKKYDVIVASTVVEVGVDIPDCTRVVVLSADRLGAASLHQIRGRAGRNSKQSKCYLVSLGKNDNSRVRLQSLVDSEDGFEIALADLSVRGEGKIFGSDQSGSSEMIFASLSKHKDWIETARKDAEDILNSPYRRYAVADAKDKFGAEERLF